LLSIILQEELKAYLKIVLSITGVLFLGSITALFLGWVYPSIVYLANILGVLFILTIIGYQVNNAVIKKLRKKALDLLVKQIEGEKSGNNPTESKLSEYNLKTFEFKGELGELDCAICKLPIEPE